MSKLYSKALALYLGGLLLASLGAIAWSSFDQPRLALLTATLIVSLSGVATLHTTRTLHEVHRLFILRLQASAWITTLFGLIGMIYASLMMP